MPSKLTIVIPCYNQVGYLQGLLESLKEQTFKDFSLVIIDDKSDDDYPGLLRDFKEFFSIFYIRNKENLGAIRNMFYAIKYPVETEYIVCLHEDDFLRNDYLESAVAVLEKNKNLAFVGSTNVTFFDDKDYLNKKHSFENKKNDTSFLDAKASNFVRYILSGKHFTFGSVVYRASGLIGKTPDLNNFSVACDRPFLLSLLKDSSRCAIFNAPFIFYRDHGYNDKRGKDLRYFHLFNLYEHYREYLTMDDKNDRKIFFRNATNHLLYSYYNLGEKDISLSHFIREGRKKKIINLFYLNKIGFFALLSLAIGHKASFKLKNFLNNFFIYENRRNKK